MNPADLKREVEKFGAEWNAAGDLERYANERNGRLIWRVYSEHREIGLPVPEVVLKCFDRWAAALGDAETPAETLRALELGGDRRRHVGRGHMAAAERRYIIAEDVRAQVVLGKAPTAAIRATARRRGLPEPDVRKAYYSLSKTKRRA